MCSLREGGSPKVLRGRLSFREPERSHSSHESLWESAEGGQVAQSPHAPLAAPEGEVSAGEAGLQPEVPGAPGPVMVAICSQPEALPDGFAAELVYLVWEEDGELLVHPSLLHLQRPLSVFRMPGVPHQLVL